MLDGVRGLPRKDVSLGTVLIADDSAVVRETIARRITAEGFGVIKWGSALLDPTLNAGGLACALIDLDLGDGEGSELAAALRNLSPTLPIAFFSAGAASDALERATQWGPVFLKPDELDQAMSWIRANAR
jgi:FixJ family two-component response regulator